MAAPGAARVEKASDRFAGFWPSVCGAADAHETEFPCP
jgi:hypothetical protein